MGDLAAQEDEFFDSWEQTVELTDGFVRDGIVNVEHYLSEAPKQLFILKEANALGESFNLSREVLAVKARWQTWNNVVRWSRAIKGLSCAGARTGNEIWDEVRHVDQAARNFWLQKVAVMNLKKVPGRSTSSYVEIVTWAERNRGRLEEQFHLLDPDVIVVCGIHPRHTPFLSTSQWQVELNEVQAQALEMDGRMRTVLWSWHPQAYKSSKKMLESLVGAWIQSVPK